MVAGRRRAAGPEGKIKGRRGTAEVLMARYKGYATRED